MAFNFTEGIELSSDFKSHAEKFQIIFRAHIFDLLIDLRCIVEYNVTVWFCVLMLIVY